jgi:predicted Zn-dependent protease
MKSEEHIKNDTFFTQQLDQAFKKFLEGNENNFLNNFETSVIFIIKRKEFFQNQNFEILYSKTEENQIILNKLNDEIKKLQSQTELLNEKIIKNQKSRKVSSKKCNGNFKNLCSIS